MPKSITRKPARGYLPCPGNQQPDFGRLADGRSAQCHHCGERLPLTSTASATRPILHYVADPTPDRQYRDVLVTDAMVGGYA